jgi:hemerythrin-like metal-binding domain
MILIWDDNFTTGIDSIDNHHKELFLLINKSLQAMKKGKQTMEIIRSLDYLEKHVVEHFYEEEEIQKNNNYPNYTLQHIQHEQFKKELKELRRTFATSGASTLFIINAQKSIATWWTNHISNMDKDFAKFLLEKTMIDDSQYMIQN